MRGLVNTSEAMPEYSTGNWGLAKWMSVKLSGVKLANESQQMKLTVKDKLKGSDDMICT